LTTTPLPLSHVRRVSWLLALAGGLIILDQATKALAIQWFMGEPALVYLGGLFRFTYAENQGAFLSLGRGLSDGLRFGLLTGLNGVILAVVLYVICRRPGLRTGVALALSLIFAGGLGNLIDRVFRDGIVVDFMNIDLGFSVGPVPMRTGVFNVADLAIMGGLFLLLGLELLPWGRKEDADAASETG